MLPPLVPITPEMGPMTFASGSLQRAVDAHGLACTQTEPFAPGVGPLDHPNRRFDRDVWLAGCETGERAAGPRNPVLWRREA